MSYLLLASSCTTSTLVEFYDTCSSLLLIVTLSSSRINVIHPSLLLIVILSPTFSWSFREVEKTNKGEAGREKCQGKQETGKTSNLYRFWCHELVSVQ